MRIVRKKKVNRRDLMLLDNEGDWTLQFRDAAYPFGYYFEDENKARSAFNRVGVRSQSGSHAVSLEDSRFKKRNASKCPNDSVEINGKCRKTSPSPRYLNPVHGLSGRNASFKLLEIGRSLVED